MQIQILNDELESITDILENTLTKVIQGAMGPLISPITLDDYTLLTTDRPLGTIPKVSRPEKCRSLQEM